MKTVATYLPRTDFCRELQEQVDGYFASTGKSRRDVPSMYVKTVVMMIWLVGSYAALLFWVQRPWQAVALAVSLGLAMAGVGFNVQHDGGHGAASERAWINKTMALSLDLLGGTAYFWHYKHNIAHHTHPNVHGHDDDINVGPLGRMSPHQRWCAAHRYQHVYMWALYALLALEWQISGELRNYFSKRFIGSTRVPVPRGGERVIFWVGKAIFFMLAFGLPLMLHPVINVLALYAIAGVTLGITLASVFQLAHCTNEADFRQVSGEQLAVPRPWAQHQIESTVDFARGSRLLSWYLGGLNFQIEHHLFPRVCHVHYAALAPIVEGLCRKHDVRYFAHPTGRAALAAHVRFLRVMGRRPVGPDAV